MVDGGGWTSEDPRSRGRGSAVDRRSTVHSSGAQLVSLPRPPCLVALIYLKVFNGL